MIPIPNYLNTSLMTSFKQQALNFLMASGCWHMEGLVWNIVQVH
jgi:hypothetical protein